MSEGIETKYRGVYRTSWGSTWTAMIQHNGDRYYLGTFSDATEAAREYDRAASELGKDYRNFPEDTNTGMES